jgi:hypothetical protein
MIGKFIVAPIILALMITPAVAQSDHDKWEVGGQFSLAKQEALSNMRDYGFGGRIAYLPVSYLAFEAEVNFYPGNADSGLTSISLTTNRMEALFGVKSGLRFNKVGVFGKLRPGLMRYSESSEPIVFPAIYPPILAMLISMGRTSFALDCGGVFEFYPSRKTLLRLDLSDLIIRFPAAHYNSEVFKNDFNIHNYRLGVGVGYRF